MLHVIPIPAFDDNYIWLLQNSDSDAAAVVDPGDLAPVVAYLKSQELHLTAILVTHKHGDHTGGISGLVKLYPEAQVFAPLEEKIPWVTSALREGSIVNIPEVGISLEALEVPGHTEGHMAYVGGGNLFCGDTLFTCGCGRVFGVTCQQLHRSLQRIALLPPETKIYCAHEYTLDNIGFAKWVEPDNLTLRRREIECRKQLEAGEATVPSTLKLEQETNPFLRTKEPVVVMAAEQYLGKQLTDPAEVFCALRNWKDQEYD